MMFYSFSSHHEHHSLSHPYSGGKSTGTIESNRTPPFINGSDEMLTSVEQGIYYYSCDLVLKETGVHPVNPENTS